MLRPTDPRYKKQDTITLELDDGSELECVVVSTFLVEGKQYISLLPMNDDGSVDDDADVYFYTYEGQGDEGDILGNIEDDEEFEMVSSYFESMLNMD